MKKPARSGGRRGTVPVVVERTLVLPNVRSSGPDRQTPERPRPFVTSISLGGYRGIGAIPGLNEMISKKKKTITAVIEFIWKAAASLGDPRTQQVPQRP